MNKLLIILLLCAPCFGQIVIQGNSLVEFAPWSSSGITPAPLIRGHDSYMCYQLAELLPADVPIGTEKVALVQATNDVHMGITPEQHRQCIEGEIQWLQTNRPGTLIYLVNVPPFDQNNCYGDYRVTIAQYNQIYKQLPNNYTGTTTIDVWTQVVQPTGWAWPSMLSGPCGIHFGQFEEPSPGWTFYMGAIKNQIEGERAF